MAVTEIAGGVHRCGTELVNWYLLVEDGRVTLVDAGLPRYWKQVDPALAAVGCGRDDVEALVLTHGDADHVGFAERLRSETGARVLIHPADEPLATQGKHKEREAPTLPLLRHRAMLGLSGHFALNGGARVPRVKEVERYADGEVLDVPGRPVVLHTPGHTEGHCVIHAAAAGVAFVGDALCTRNPGTGRPGPQLLPRAMTTDTRRALASLDRIAALDAVLAPGHGDMWTRPAAEAVEQARTAGTT